MSRDQKASDRDRSKNLAFLNLNSQHGEQFTEDQQCDHRAAQDGHPNAVTARAEGFGSSVPAFLPSQYRSPLIAHEGSAASFSPQAASLNFHGAALTNPPVNTMQYPVGLHPHYYGSAGPSRLESSLQSTSLPMSLVQATQRHFAMQPIAAPHHSSISPDRQYFLRMNQALSYEGSQPDQERQLIQRSHEFQHTFNGPRLFESSRMDSGSAGIGASCSSAVPHAATSLMGSLSTLHQRPQILHEAVAASTTLTKNKPKRPLSAYNIFFKEERKKLIEEVQGKLSSQEEFAESSLDDTETVKRRKKHHGIGFEEMAKEIGKRWKKIDADRRAVYGKKAEDDKKRYKAELEVHKEMRFGELEAAREELEATVSETTRRKYLNNGGVMESKRRATGRKK